MSTVTQLVTRVCELAGVNSTAASADRARVLTYLNEAYRQAIMETRGNIVSLAATLSGSDVALSTLGITRFAGFDELVSGTTTFLPSTEEGIQSARRGNVTASGGSYVEYAVVGGSLLMVYPAQVALPLAGTYYQKPLALVESGAVGGTSESTPSAIDDAWHEDILGERATALVFRFMRSSGEAQACDAAFRDALERYKRWLRRASGNMVPSTGIQWWGESARDYLP